MTELQFYKYIFENLNTCEDEISWNGEELCLQIPAHELDDFMEFIEEDKNEELTPMSYYCGKIYIDLVPICEWFGINPKNILEKE